MNTNQWVLSRNYNVGTSLHTNRRNARSFSVVSIRMDRSVPTCYLYLADRARPPTQHVPTRHQLWIQHIDVRLKTYCDVKKLQIL